MHGDCPFIVAVVLMAMLLGLLATSAHGQDLPSGVTLKDGVYHVERRVLKSLKRSQIRGYKGLAKEYEIKYKIIPNKK